MGISSQQRGNHRRELAPKALMYLVYNESLLVGYHHRLMHCKEVEDID